MRRPLWQRLGERVAGGQLSAVQRKLLTDVLSEAESGEVYAIPALLPFVFSAEPQIGDEAVEAIVSRTADFTATEWRRLDPVMRSHAAPLPFGFLKITPESLETLNRFEKHQWLLLGLAGMNGNGYVRQEAVRRLALLSDRELPFLLLRLNDWVAEVRQEARAACVARLRPEYAARYVAALPLVLGLADVGRQDLGDFIASVEELLLRPECRLAFTKGLASGEAVTRRAAFRIALAATGKNGDAATVFQQAFLSRDPVVRRQAARLLCARPAGDAVQAAFLDRLGSDTLAAIRAEYLLLCREKYTQRSGRALRDALLDPHPSVRSVAQYYLRRYESFDLPTFYREAVEARNAARLAPAIAGLGETGQASDAERVREFGRHPSSTVRRAVVVALGRLDGEHETPRLLRAVHDVGARVSRAAREALQPRAFLLDDEMLWENLTSATAFHSRRNLLRLINALPKWRAAVLLIRAASWLHEQPEDDAEGELRAYLQNCLRGFRGSAVPPTREQMDALHQSLEEASPWLPEAVLAEWRFTLQSAERLAR